MSEKRKNGRKGKDLNKGKMQNQLVNKLKNARKVVAITGAGISAESGKLSLYFLTLPRESFFPEKISN